MRHVFSLMALSWLALAVNWASVNEWAHATVTALAGVVCYAAADRFQQKGDRPWASRE